jgi:hypothetical protein
MDRRTFLSACAAARAWGAAGAPRALDVAPVWAGHPVGFAFLTQGGRQYIAFYDDQRRMTVAARAVTSTEWQFVRLPSEVKWDSHNSIAIVLHKAGLMHLAGNMHVAPLVYFRTSRPGDVTSFERVPAMVGRNETRCTYPHFLRGPKDELIFTYRDGRSGDGSQIYKTRQKNSWVSSGSGSLPSE